MKKESVKRWKRRSKNKGRGLKRCLRKNKRSLKNKC
jgi:hypothetical protein